MVLKYSNVKDFCLHLGIARSTFDYQGGQHPSREELGIVSSNQSVFYTNSQHVVEDTLIISTLAGVELTETTHYTIDYDKGEITITAGGITAYDGDTIYASYFYNEIGVLNSELKSILEHSEDELEQITHTVFANQSATSPNYKAITDEYHVGQGVSDNYYSLRRYPVVKLQTTVNGSYTTGGSTITLTDASGFPSSGTIYIGGNKVSYTSKSSNDLTIPVSTPSITDGVLVRGEVIEVSLDSSGLTPLYQVLAPLTDYDINYDTGDIVLLDDYYNQGSMYDFSKPPRGVSNRLRVTYLNAWHRPGEDCVIPTEIEKMVYMVATRIFRHTSIMSSHINRREEFNPTSLSFSEEYVEKKVAKYTCLPVSRV